MPFEILRDDHSDFPVITLRDLSTQCEAEIYAFGALLNAFRIKLNGTLFNAVDGFHSPAEALKEITAGFKSARLSPFVCRLHKGQYDFNDQHYRVEKFYMGEEAIHGIIYDAVYTVTNTVANENKAELVLSYQYKGTDKGYPFRFDTEVAWRLEKENKLTVCSRITNKESHSIPYAEGWHPYFTLGTGLDDCSLQFDSDTMLEFDSALLPTGKKIKDERFRKGISLKGIELDNAFELEASSPHQCILSNQQLQLIIQPDLSFPYLQVYIPGHRNSIAIENLSSPPDAFNNKMNLLLAEPGASHTFTTSYQLQAV